MEKLFRSRTMKQGHERSTNMQQGSKLLSPEENQTLVTLLGPKCQSLSTSVIQLFLTEPPDHSQWKRRDAGVMCFVKDHIKRSHFLRLYCLSRRQMVWENEVYNSLEYMAPRAWLHTFEADTCMAAFNFADEEEAHHFRQMVTVKLEAKRQRRAERRSRQSLSNHQALNYQGSVPNIPSATGHHYNHNGPAVNKHQRSTSSGGGSKKKMKDPKRRLTKADIGMPVDFRHVSHVGWDPNKGLDGHGDVLEDPNLKQFFDKAGVSETHLKDRKTREFIYDFINTHGGFEAVKEDVVPGTTRAPPVPSRAPPPHPGSAKPSPPQPPSAQYKPTHSPGVNHQRTAPPPPPPPPATYPTRPVVDESRQVAPAPPPPPPPPMASQVGGAAPEPDSRAALMAAIKSGKTLKHVDPEKKAVVGQDSRGELLDQIKKGIELKSVTQNERPAGGAPMDGLAGALARALADRNRAFHDSDSESESDREGDSDSEWEE